MADLNRNHHRTGLDRIDRTGTDRTRARWRWLSLLAALPLLAGCTTLPGESNPQALRGYEAATSTADIAAPQKDQAPDLLLRDFFSAAAHPAQDHAAARQFLMPDAAEKWNDRPDMLIISRLDISTESVTSGDELTYKVRGSVVGKLGPGGAYDPQNGAYEEPFTLRKNQEGQWRISSLPQGVIVERPDFLDNYAPHDVLFFDNSERFLVPDRRWILTTSDFRAASLMNLLASGPRQQFQPSLRSKLPPGSAVSVDMSAGNITINFTGLGELSPSDRTRLAAQSVWTLAASEIRGPYFINSDGVPLLGEFADGWNIEDVSEYDPQASSEAVGGLYALQDGRLRKVVGNSLEPVAGGWGTASDLESVSVAPNGTEIAGVRSNRAAGRDGSELVMGTESGDQNRVLSAKTLTRPSWGADSGAVWTVVDGHRVVRVVRSSSGETSQSEVESSELADLKGAVSVFETNRSDSVAAMIMDGRVYIASIAWPSAGTRKLENVREIAFPIGSTALSLAWNTDGSLLVGTSSADSPVWRIEADGSANYVMSSRNINAPVVAVASTRSMLYATDASSLVQLSPGAGKEQFWREVPAMQGTRAVPVTTK